MSEGNIQVSVRSIGSIADIAADQWDACAGGADPFLCHAYLRAMEDSGSACARTGWAPRHLLAEDGQGSLLACAPLYLKSHSYGEYVFDWAWADAYRRAGRRYYPKLQCALPFTPVTGRRLLVRPGAPETALQALLAETMIGLARKLSVSSLHVTFCTEAESRLLQGKGMLSRIGHQYHWRNRGYGRFDDFLAALSSRKRKAIRKERAQAQALGLEIRALSGPDLRPEHWDAFHDFYRNTVDRKWANAYLTADFFHRLGAVLGDRVVLILALQHGQPVAAALNLAGDDALYGRLWGSVAEFRFLHFELCYYQAIDWAISHGLSRVEAGAQGEHKLQRGYLPVATHSAHWIADSDFRAVLARFLDEERSAMLLDIAEGVQAGPYRCD